MERSLITWSIPNMVTVWLMFAGGLIVYAVVAQVFKHAGIGPGASEAETEAGAF